MANLAAEVQAQVQQAYPGAVGAQPVARLKTAAIGQPAECAGQAGCGVMCFYVSENATENQYELTCVAWVFE